MIDVCARAVAHSNIALIKYWGKADPSRNLPAVPSLSMTLDGLSTRTHVRFDRRLSQDVVTLNGNEVQGRPRDRVVRMLSEVRRMANISWSAHVQSTNDFPTASGLASSASGFAALALAATRAAGLSLSPAAVSAIARQSSASAARSVYGGFVVLDRGAEAARPVLAASDWPLRMLVVLTTLEAKAIGSTEAMELCRTTSPYYQAWLNSSTQSFEGALAALQRRDFEALGTLMEQSTMRMHASMLAATPPILYLRPTTLELLARVQGLRQRGTPAFYTMDAGPHVKVLVEEHNAVQVADALRRVPGIARIIDCGVGPDASFSVTPGEEP